MNATQAFNNLIDFNGHTARVLIVGADNTELWRNIAVTRENGQFHLETLDKYPDTIGAYTDDSGKVYVDFGKWVNFEYNPYVYWLDKRMLAKLARATNQVCLLVKVAGQYFLIFSDGRKKPVYLGNASEQINHARNYVYWHKLSNGSVDNDVVMVGLTEVAVRLANEGEENFTLNTRSGDIWQVCQQN